MTLLVRVVAPHFVAGLVLDEHGQCIEAAPIIGWCVGKGFPELRAYFKRKGWKAALAPTPKVPE